MNKDFFGKRESLIVSGVAVLMMLFHHFFGFADFLTEVNHWISLFNVGGVEIERCFAAFGKLCVGIFAFVSGYVIWKKNEEYISLTRILKRILKFLMSYWIVFALFLIYGLCAGEEIPTGSAFIQNMFGLATGPNFPYINVAFAWYVAFYCSLLLLTPCLLFLFKRNFVKVEWGGLLVDVILLICITLLINIIPSLIYLDFLYPLPISLVGLLVCKYDLFGKLYSKIGHHISTFVSLMIIAAVALVRQGLLLFDIPQIGIEDGIFSFFFIFAVITLTNRLKCKKIDQLFIFIGTQSMNLWFLHGIFFTGSKNLQWLLYFPHYPLLIFCWGVLLLLPLCLLCNYLQSLLYRVLK